MNFYKHHLGDYDGATAHLSWEEDMAYTRLLRVYYRREQPIPDAERHRLVRAASAGQRRAVDTVLAEFFQRDGEVWRNKRADEEIEAYQAIASRNREVGKQGGRPKKTTPVAKGNPQETQMVSRNNPSHKPEPEPEKERAGRSRGSRLPAGWKPTEQQVAWARAERPDLDPNAAADRFRDYWHGVAGSKGVKLDWEATWRNWIRGEKRGAPAQITAVQQPCGNCRKPITGGWSQSPKGRVCDDCHRGYMAGAWPERKAA